MDLQNLSGVRTGILSLGGWGQAWPRASACCCSCPLRAKWRSIRRCGLFRCGHTCCIDCFGCFLQTPAAVSRLHALRCGSSTGHKIWIETTATEQHCYLLRAILCNTLRDSEGTLDIEVEVKVQAPAWSCSARTLRKPPHQSSTRCNFQYWDGSISNSRWKRISLAGEILSQLHRCPFFVHSFCKVDDK